MSVPVNQMANILTVAMTPQQAALAASENLPFAFNGSAPGSLLQFETALRQNGMAIESTQTPTPTTPDTSHSAHTTGSDYNAFIGSPAFAGIWSGMLIGEHGADAVKKTFSWLDPSTWANVGLVIVGAVLALGALLISQKKTVVKIADTAAKTAALLS